MEEEKPKKKLFKIELTRNDKIAIIALIIFVVLLSIPTFLRQGVARPGFEIADEKDVMIENCVYWGQYSCDTSSDISLTQIEWYIKGLCEIQNLECSNLKLACNQVTGNQTCPTFG
jgi:hypothetical protein